MRGAGQAARERAVVNGDRTHEQADRAERPRVIMRGDGDDRPQPAKALLRHLGLAADIEAIAFGQLDAL